MNTNQGITVKSIAMSRRIRTMSDAELYVKIVYFIGVAITILVMAFYFARYEDVDMDASLSLVITLVCALIWPVVSWYVIACFLWKKLLGVFER